MDFNFFGVYFQDTSGIEYRCGFHDDNQYQPLLETRMNNDWINVGSGANTRGPANGRCATIREGLPITIPFPVDAHTQNQRMELINQVIYNIRRKATESVNYGGAHEA